MALVRLLGATPDREPIVAALAVPVDGRVDALTNALITADDETAPLLVAALIRMRRTEASQAVVELASVPNVAARKAVIAVLPSIKTAEAKAALAAASADPDPEVRGIAQLMLER